MVAKKSQRKNNNKKTRSNQKGGGDTNNGIDSIQFRGEVKMEDYLTEGGNPSPDINELYINNVKAPADVDQVDLIEYLKFLIRSDLHPSSQIKVMINSVGTNCGNPVASSTGCNLPGETKDNIEKAPGVIFLCGVSLDADNNCSTSLHFPSVERWKEFHSKMISDNSGDKFKELVNLNKSGNHAAWKPYSKALMSLDVDGAAAADDGATAAAAARLAEGKGATNATGNGGRKRRNNKRSRQKKNRSVKNNRGKTQKRLQRSRKNRNRK